MARIIGGLRAVGRLLRRHVVTELRLYQALLRWLARRPDVPTGARPFGYLGPVQAVLWVFVVVSAVELVVLHLIIPWEGVRIAADALGVWGLLWMLGLLAAYKVRPHTVGGAGIRVRLPFGDEFVIPHDAVADASVRERGRESASGVQLDRAADGAVLNVVTGGRTNVDITLRRPLTFRHPAVPEPVTRVRWYADDPRGLVDAVRQPDPTAVS